MISNNRIAQDATKQGYVFPLSRAEQAILRYRQWLINQAQYDREREKRDGDEYAFRASKTLTVRNREIRPFAPFNDNMSALRTFTAGQVVAVICIFLASVACFFINFGTTFLAAGVLFSFTGFFYNLILLLLSAGALAWDGDIKIADEIVHALDDADWPTYTILCPLYKEAKVVRQLVEGLQKLDYPADKLEIFLQVEEYDDETREALCGIAMPDYFHIILLPQGEPRTKARSCNYALLQATGQYLVIYDAEDIPDPLQLKKAVLAFADSGPETVCIQAKLNFYNSRQNPLTRWFTAEYSTRYDLTLPTLCRANLTIPLGGGSNHFRTAALRQVGAWDVYNVTEDCELGMRLGYYGFKTALLDSTTYEEASSQLGNWTRQRSRWIKGFMQTYLVYMRDPWRYVAERRWLEFFSLQLIVGGNIASVLAFHISNLLLLCSIILWLTSGRRIFLLTGAIIIAAMLISMLLGQMLACAGLVKRRQYDLLKWMVLHPAYLFLMGIASQIAVYQLIVKPHYWEKTDHESALQTASTRSSGIDRRFCNGDRPDRKM